MSFKFINGDVTSNRSLLGANQLGNALQLNAVRDYYRFKILSLINLIGKAFLIIFKNLVIRLLSNFL